MVFDKFNLVYPTFRGYLNYYKEYWKLYLENWMLISKVKAISEENKKIQWKLSGYRHKNHYYRKSHANDYDSNLDALDKLNKRKKRRTAAEIPKPHCV